MIGNEHKKIIAEVDLINGDLNEIKKLSITYSTDQNEFFNLISRNALERLDALHSSLLSLNMQSVNVISACRPVIKNTAILLQSGGLTYEHSIEIYRTVLRVAEMPEDKNRINELERVANELSGPGIISKIIANLYKAMGKLLMYVGTESGKKMGEKMVARADAVLNIKGTLFAAHKKVAGSPESKKMDMKSNNNNNNNNNNSNNDDNDDYEGIDLLGGR